MNETLYDIEEPDILLESKLIVFNDEVNTFEWVIECLVEVLKHNKQQAEQCAYIINYKGKCIVKTAEKKILLPLKDNLCERGLSAIID